MASQRAQSSVSTDAIQRDEVRVPANQGERDGDVLRGVVSSSIEVFFESRDADRRGAQLPEQQTE